MRSISVLLIAGLLLAAACSDGRMRECDFCPPDVLMRVDDVTVRGTPGGGEWTFDRAPVIVEAWAVITPKEATTIPFGADGVIEMPDGMTGRAMSAVAVGSATPRRDRDALASWLATDLSRSASVHEFEQPPSAYELDVPLSTLIPAPGQYVLRLFVTLEDGWVEYGLFVTAGHDGER